MTESPVPLIDLPHLYSGKVRDIYDAGDDRLLLVTSDRMSAFDVVMAEPIPDKGRVLTAMSAFWFEHFADVVGSHLISTDLADLPPRPRRIPELGRPRRCCAARPRCCRSSASCAATSPARPGRSTAPTGTMHGAPLPERAARVVAAARAGVHPVDQGRGRRATTRTSRSTQAVDLVGAELAERARDVSLELYRAGGRVGRRAGHHHRRHQVRARPRRRRAHRLRRGAHARLVALLAGRPVEARHHPAVVRQAAGARLPRRPRLGQAAAAAAAARRGRRRPPATATSRPTSASPAARSPTGPASPDPGGTRRERVRRRCGSCATMGR